MRPRHGYAYAPSSLGPSQCPGTHPPPARWPPRQPCRLRARKRVRTECAPPAAPQCPDHTHVQLSQRRGSHPRKTSGPVRWPLLPLAGWFSVTPGLRPSPPHPQKPAGRPPLFGAILTLFGAPAGRSVFSLPAGPDANVEKDGSSASLTAMSDSPGGCLRAGRGTSRSQGATHDRRSAASHRPPAFTPPHAPRCTYLINVGAQKVLGSPKQWGYPNPKVNEEGEKKDLETKPKPKTPNCPRSFFGLNINGRCLFKKSSFVYESS